MLKRLLPCAALLAAGCMNVERSPPEAVGEPLQPQPTATATVPDIPLSPPSSDQAQTVTLRLRFAVGQTSLSPQARAVLDAVAAAYRRGDDVRLMLSVAPGESAAVRQARLSAVRSYLLSCGVPAGQLGARVRIAQVVASPALSMNEGGPVATGDDPDRVVVLANRPTHRTAMPVASRPVSLAAIDSWLQPGGTLANPALAALIGECVRRDGRLSADCRGAAKDGVGAFAKAPQPARDEFVLLLDRCRSMAATECPRLVAAELLLRGLDIGRLFTAPAKMREDEPATFTAVVKKDASGALRIEPGREFSIAPVPPPASAGDDGPAAAAPAIPIAGKMCMELTARAADFRIDQPAKQCATEDKGMGDVRYSFRWQVTPLRAGDLDLRLETTVDIHGEERRYPMEPYPTRIAVAARPGVQERLDAAIRDATATVKLTIGLAEALGALGAIVAGWSIWTWFRRRKRSPRRRAASPRP